MHQSLPIMLDGSNRHSLSLGALKRQENVGSLRTKNDPYMVMRGQREVDKRFRQQFKDHQVIVFLDDTAFTGRP
jgi:hypothetical protein